MCGIFCAFSKQKVIELSLLNSYRGSHSFSVLDYNSKVLHKGFGPFNDRLIGAGYAICHVQAPTTSERSMDNIHPSEINGTYLWHNGIIKDFSIEDLNTLFVSADKWDTKLLHRVVLSDWGHLSTINGSFACIFMESDKIFVFRNEISPLFVDSDLSISSVKFLNSESLPANKVFELDLLNRRIIDTGIVFETLENPYFFG